MVFINLEKACDNVSREFMGWVLEKKGVRTKYTKLIKDIHIMEF